MNKLYWSKTFDPTNWARDADFLTIYLVPKRWWSWRSWKFAYSVRARMLECLNNKINKGE